MSWFIAFISAGILLGLSAIRMLNLKEKRKKNQKEAIWDKQLEDLLQSLKKKKE